MALNGTAWTAQFRKLASFLEGETPNELTPVAGGDAIPFNHDGERREFFVPEGSQTRIGRTFLDVSTRSALALGASYTWNGQTWEVVTNDRSDVGAGKGIRHYTLVRHAQ